MDGRIITLDSLTANDLNTLKASIDLIFDDPSFAEAHKINLFDFLYNSSINQDDIDFLPMTPKSFRLTTAETNRPGIISKATTQQINEKSGGGAITASDLVTIFNNRDTELNYTNGAFALQGDNPSALNCVRFSATYTYNSGPNIYHNISPSLPVNKIYAGAHITFAARADGTVNGNTDFQSYDGVETGTYALLTSNTGVIIGISGNGKYVQIRHTSGTYTVSIAIDVVAVLKNA